ncbi:MAG: DMT family transporter [Pseudomonadota bacterium]|nr:DMT family transporter [Pseudomonadota bacterium]
MVTTLIYPIIIVAGVLQALGPPMNGVLYRALVNPWLATLVSFALVVAFFLFVAVMIPKPLPTPQAVASMPWWAPLGGIAGAFAVAAGLLFVDKIGAGPYAALTIGANLLMSIVLDQFGLINMPVHTVGLWRGLGAVLMIVGVALIARF